MLGYLLLLSGLAFSAGFWFLLSDIFFKGVDLTTPRNQVTQAGLVLVSWPARFMAYRSGHGAHAV